MKRITKFKSKNLLGENRKEEEKRLRNERIKAILSGKVPSEVKEINRGGALYLKGTTRVQRKRREKLLN